MFEELKIESLRRLRSSRNGNPAFEITFTEATMATGSPTARTGTDSSVAYEIENPEYLNVPLRVEFTKAGRVVGVWTV